MSPFTHCVNYRVRMKPEIGTIFYALFRMTQWFSIVHSIIDTTCTLSGTVWNTSILGIATLMNIPATRDSNPVSLIHYGTSHI